MIRAGALLIWLLTLVAPHGIANAAPAWDDFQIIMWQSQTPAQWAALHQIGVRTVRVTGVREGPLDPALATARAATAAGMGVFIENIATDFYAPYHRYSPDHPGVPNWLFEQTRARQRAKPTDVSVYQRTPSLVDRVWQSRIRARLAEHVRAFAPSKPLYYNLGDEVGIADLAAHWDFDFSLPALAEFRVWLRTQYANLDALNHQWDTHFPDWDSIVPELTAVTLARQDGNFSAWADFRAWMDFSFAQALRLGSDAVHASDRNARAAIEGAQAPGPGGFDYSLLPLAVDVIEGAESGGNFDIARALNPELVTLTTSFEGGSSEIGRIWRSVLAGSRGLMIWDDKGDFATPDGKLGTRGQSLAPLFTELTGGLAAQIFASTALPDKVAILYSPASQRTLWLLDRLGKGAGWMAKGNMSEAEGSDNHAARRAIERTSLSLAHLGIRPRFLTPALIERGALRSNDLRMLILPQALALSQREADEITAFALAGGIVVADLLPGQYDEHSRKLASPRLTVLLRHGKILKLPDAVLADPSATNLAGFDAMATLLTQARSKPEIRLLTPNNKPATGVETRLFRNGAVLLISLQRTLSGKEAVLISVSTQTRVYDLRKREAVPHGLKLSLTVQDDQPTILAFSPSALPVPILAGPSGVQLPGKAMQWRISLATPSAAAVHVMRADWLGPDGAPRPQLSTRLHVRDTPVDWTATLPAEPGRWTLVVSDMLSGAVVQATVEVGG